MARVHLVSLDPEELPPGGHPDTPLSVARKLRESAVLDRFGAHTLTDDPEAADLILFVRALGRGAIFGRLLHHSLVRRHRRKCFLYDPNDRVVAVLPGIYPSIEKPWYTRGRVRSGAYLLRDDNPALDQDRSGADRRFLYSFAGGYQTAGVRHELGRLDHPRGFCRDTFAEGDRINRRGTPEEKAEFRRRYLELTWASSFVLCPRGYGVSSMRLFETMRAGRAPVILADDWVAPEGPAWDRFSVRIGEGDWASIPARLQGLEPHAAAMGQLARREWEDWYAPPVLFHRTVEDCLSIAATPRLLPEPVNSWVAWLQMGRPSHVRHWLRATGQAVRIKQMLRLDGWRGRK